MDQQQTQNIEQASEQLTNATQQSFQMLSDRMVGLQESNLRLAQNFFHDWIEQVNNQAQGTREATQGLAEQGQVQREAFKTLSQEATNATSEFLNSALSFYQEALSTAMQVGQQNIQQGAQATSQAGQQGAEAANQSAQQGAQAGEQAAQEANQAAQDTKPSNGRRRGSGNKSSS